MNRELAAAARRFADAQSSRLADMPTAHQILATIVTVVAGGASDGNALVTVTWRGNPVVCAGYAAAYTPVVGHRVVCDLVANQLLVAYRVIGTP